MFLRRILYFILFAGSVVYYFADGEWFSSLVLLSIVTLPLLSLVLCLLGMKKTRATVKLASKIEMGTKVQCVIDISGPLPSPIFRGKLKGVNTQTGEKNILSVGEPFPTEHCGGLTVELYRAKVYDYLGLFSRKIRSEEPLKICIFPRPVQLLLPDGKSQYLSSDLRPKAGGGLAENHEIRPYREGDPLSLVHWKLTAKLDDLMVREPMVPVESRLKVALAMHGSCDEIDLKLGKLLSLSYFLTEKEQSFEVIAFTGHGVKTRRISTKQGADQCIRELLFSPLLKEKPSEDFSQEKDFIYIGGENEP